MCLENVQTDPTQRAQQFQGLMNHDNDCLKRIFTKEIPVINLWLPNTTDKEVSDHYNVLQAPTLCGKPCLLLHELGKDQGTPLNRHDSARLEEWQDREERRGTEEIGSLDVATVISPSGCMARQGLKHSLPTLPPNTIIHNDCLEANKLSDELEHNNKIAA
ncbi:hypothetical protein C0995_011790, partial [Termitomyces sp. Mi166